jgi:hypothetical protein
MSKDLTIGEAAKAAGLSIDAVRFYERQGIMAPPPRLAGGRRAYGDANLPLPLASLLRDRVLQALASGDEALNVSALARVAAAPRSLQA